MFYKATDESPRMFASDFIDGFSRIPALFVPVLFVPIIGALVWAGWAQGVSVAGIAAQVALGFFVWTFAEYWLHRTLFHWVPGASWGERFHFLLHGVHHDWPNDKLRLVMPPAASLGLGALFLGAYYGLALALSPWLAPTWVWAFFAGKVAGYVNYDMTHYWIHHFKPRSKWGKRLKAHHMNHHHNKDGRKYGVSFMFWDRVFGTM